MRKPPAWHGQAFALKAAHPEMTLAEIGLKCCVSTTAVFHALHHRPTRQDERNRFHAQQRHHKLKKENASDISSRLGAERLAQQIKAYWAAKGYQIEAWAQERPFEPSMRSRRWEVVTDMINGAPRGYQAPEKAA